MSVVDGLADLVVPIDSLQALPGNPRKGDVEAVAASLARFGQRKPIVVRSSDRTITAGNHTWLAAKSLGWSEIAAVVLDDDDATAGAYALADNRTAELGGYDERALLDLIRQVGESDPALLADTGWDEASVAELVEQMEPSLPDVLPPDEEVEPPAVAKSAPGDVYLLGEHRLICGDSTDRGIWQALMGADLADLMFTDPPYNVAVTGGTHDPRDKKNHGKGPRIANDSMSDADFAGFLARAYGEMHQFTRPGGSIYVCHADTEGINFRVEFKNAGFFLHEVLIWVKQEFVFGRSDYHWQHEPILYGWKLGAAHQFHGARNQSTTWTIDRPMRSSMDHPTQKPVDLPAKAIQNSSARGNLVADPFGGAGSTLLACEATGRRARLIELDPRYVDVICRRWQDFTGGKPVLESTGEVVDFTDAAA